MNWGCSRKGNTKNRGLFGSPYKGLQGRRKKVGKLGGVMEMGPFRYKGNGMGSKMISFCEPLSFGPKTKKKLWEGGGNEKEGGGNTRLSSCVGEIGRCEKGGGVISKSTKGLGIGGKSSKRATRFTRQRGRCDGFVSDKN